jgi:hypothetical protein
MKDIKERVITEATLGRREEGREGAKGSKGGKEGKEGKEQRKRRTGREGREGRKEMMREEGGVGCISLRRSIEDDWDTWEQQLIDTIQKKKAEAAEKENSSEPPVAAAPVTNGAPAEQKIIFHSTFFSE